MADSKISALTPATTPLSGTEIIPVVQGGVNKRTTIDDILANDTDPVTSVNTFTGAVTLTQDNVGDGTTYKQYSATEKTKLAGVATGATANDTDANLKARANHTGTQLASTISDFTTAAQTAAPAETTTTVGTLISGATGKTTPVDADSLGLSDSAASNVLKKLTWANVKATLKTYFDTLYAGITHSHAESDITGLTTDLAAKQATLVSGTNIKTVNGSSLLGSGDLTVSGGSGSPGGSSTQIQYNDGAGGFAGAANATIENGNIRLPAISTPSTPASDGINIFGRKVAGRTQAAFIGPFGLDSLLQETMARNKVSTWLPAGNGTSVSTNGFGVTAIGTATAANVSTTNLHTWTRGIEYLVTAAATTAIAGYRIAAAQYGRGNMTGAGGFWYVSRFGPATGVSTATNRLFTGFRNVITAPTDVEPSSLINIIGAGWDAADTNIQLMYNDGTGTATKVDTGIAVPTVDRTSMYELAMFCAPNGSTIYFEFTDLVNGTVFTANTTTDIPSSTTLLSPQGWMSVGGTSSVIGYALKGLYIATDLT